MNEKFSIIFIKFWKVLQYLYIIIAVIFFSAILFTPSILKPTIQYVSFQAYILFAIYFLLCPVILLGLYKKRAIGYYASILLLLSQIINAIYGAIFWIASDKWLATVIEPLPRILFSLAFLFLIYKSRKFFGVK